MTRSNTFPAFAKCKLVDPPPLVQLRIHELNPNGAEENITHIANANCFLVVALEPTNHLVQAHSMPNSKGRSVLVGHTCAGMVLQDDSAPVGHFTFPDLSVRYGDHFRLSFSLYERIKSTGDSHTRDEACSASSPGDEHFAYRLEVKSKVL